MESSTKQKSRRRRTPTGAYSGRTKKDKWLEDRIGSLDDLAAVISPPAPYPYPSKSADNCQFRVRVIQVDRYDVQLEFCDHVSEFDGAIWWVSKDSIRAIGFYVEPHDDEGFEEDDEEDDL